MAWGYFSLLTRHALHEVCRAFGEHSEDLRYRGDNTVLICWGLGLDEMRSILLGAVLGRGQFWQFVEATRVSAGGRRSSELNYFVAGCFCFVALPVRDESRSWRKERGGRDQRGRHHSRAGRGGGGSTVYIYIYILFYSIGFDWSL